MFNLYRDLQGIFWGGSTALLVLAVVCSSYFLTDAALTITIILMVLAMFILAFVLQVKADARLQQLQEQLLDQGRTREYIAAYEALLLRPAARDKNIASLLYNNLAIGYSQLGDDASTFRVMQYAVPASNKSANGRRRIAVYCNNMTLYYLEAGDADNAEKAASDLRQVLSTFKRNDPIQIQRYNLLMMELEIRLLRGQTDGIKVALEIDLRNETRLTGLVRTHRDLAQVCLLEGDAASAVEHLQFILQYGGDTRHVAWAREKMESLKG